MNQLIEYNNSLKEGEKKIENNDFFQDLCVLMENEEFKRFFDKHMNNWIDIKCSVTYMHLYNQFKSRYNEINDKELDNRIIVYLLSKIMKDKILRPWSINTIDKMLSDHKVNFFEEFESIMLTNKLN
jgi:predicted nucleic-acid-binding Zn-ribbon protein